MRPADSGSAGASAPPPARATQLPNRLLPFLVVAVRLALPLTSSSPSHTCTCSMVVSFRDYANRVGSRNQEADKSDTLFNPFKRRPDADTSDPVVARETGTSWWGGGGIGAADRPDRQVAGRSAGFDRKVSTATAGRGDAAVRARPRRARDRSTPPPSNPPLSPRWSARRRATPSGTIMPTRHLPSPSHPPLPSPPPAHHLTALSQPSTRW